MAYRGIVGKLPVGSQGFTGTRNLSQAGPGHFTAVDGAELDGGIIRKEGGAQKVNVEVLGGTSDVRTKLLLHMDGVHATTIFTDSSPAPKTFTANGNAQLDITQSKFGGASGAFDGTGDYITTPDSADFTLGAGDWTVDFWFKCDVAAGTVRHLCGQCDAAASAASTSFRIGRTAGNVIQAIACVGGVTFTVTGTTQFTSVLNNIFNHLAFVREASILRLFINGVQEGGDVAISGTVNDSSNAFSIGRAGEVVADTWLGHIDEFRQADFARWTVPFTPPIFASSNLISPGAVILSGINWSPIAGSNHDVVFLSNGQIRRDTGPGSYTDILATGLTSVREPPPLFVTAGGEAVGASRKLFMFSGPNQVQVASGIGNFASIASPPADWTGGAFPTFGVQHGLRLFGGGNNSDPHRIYYSTIASHGDFLGAGSGTLSIFPGEGERLVAGISFRGALILFKYPVGIYIVNTSDPTPANWQIVRMTRSVGSLNQHCIVQVENDVLYMDHVGNVHALSATQEFGDINTSNLSKFSTLEPFIRAEMNLITIRRTVGIWYAAKRQAWFSMPRLGSVDNNIRLILGFDEGGDPNQARTPPRVFLSRRDIAVSMWLRPDTTFIPRPTIGDNDGTIWRLDDPARNKAGVAYPILFETANTDLSFLDQSLATKMKAGQFLELASEPRGNWNLTVSVFWDDILTDVLQFRMGGTGAALGSFLLDTDILGSDTVTSQRQRVVGSGRRVKLSAENAGLDQDVSVSEFHMNFNVMDERVRD